MKVLTERVVKKVKTVKKPKEKLWSIHKYVEKFVEKSNIQEGLVYVCAFVPEGSVFIDLDGPDVGRWIGGDSLPPHCGLVLSVTGFKLDLQQNEYIAYTDWMLDLNGFKLYFLMKIIGE